jgi:DNA-binding NarL/FixJ family response regulator
MKTRAVLVDDHELVLDGVRSLLGQVEHLEISAYFTTAEDTLNYVRSNDADLLIMDLNLPGMDGLSLIPAVKRIRPEMRIIVLTMHNEIHLVKEILRTGVNAYVLKHDSHKELVAAIHQVMTGKLFISADVSKMLVRDLQHPEESRLLTDREQEILRLIAKEYSNKDIAEALFISERTVETHRKNIFRKTRTSSLVGLIKFAYANNLI